MKGPYFTVPAGTPVAECRGCGAPIYWVQTARGRLMPVICDADERCTVPTATEVGLGLSHFADCRDADRFRGKGAA